MAEVKGLQVAVDQAKRVRDAAVQRLGQVRQQRQGAQRQLDQLTSYFAETEQKWILRGQVGLAPEVMHHHLQFMNRLSQTIELQNSNMAQHDRALQEAERQLLKTELRLASLRQVIERRDREAQLAVLRREQKETDELAASRFRLHAQAPI